MIAVLRPYWKCLQSLNDNDTNESLEAYLHRWDEKQRKPKNVPFYIKGTIPPEGFALTGFYPLYSDEENVRLDKELDDLIKATDLFVPDKRTCLISSDNTDELLKLLSGKSIEVASGSLSDLLDRIGSRKVRNKLIFYVN